MNKEGFLKFVAQSKWTFAKSVPNWPHFYIVEKDLPDQVAFRAAKAFVRESGRVGKFFDLDVFYFDADGWTYWASPLAKPPESQYMLNKCKTEYSYEACARSGKLPPEGFITAMLSLTPILEDPDFESLVRASNGPKFSVFEVMGTADYEIRHSNVLSWLLDQNGNHNQGATFLELLWECVAGEHGLPNLPFRKYSVTREGEDESERIDLLIRAENREWVIVIENKLFSPETGDQLQRYFKDVESRHAKVSHRFYFYLTPEGITPANDDDRRNWRPISYSIVTSVVSKLLERKLPERVKGFLEQYVEHIQKNVLRNVGILERQREILNRHANIFHSLAHVLDEEYIQRRCGEAEINMLKSILAVQKEVRYELFEFTKLMVAEHGYSSVAVRDTWITIEPPKLREKLFQVGLLSAVEAKKPLPIMFSFASYPHSYAVSIGIYKYKPLYSKLRGRVRRFSAEGPQPNRGDEHLEEKWFYKTIINADQILRESLPELKQRIAAYFEANLKKDLEESVAVIGKALDSIAR